MTKQTISVDIDDVLSHSAAQIIAYGNEHFGLSHGLEDFTEDLASLWQVEPEEVEQRWLGYIESGNIANYDVIPEALAVLQKLKQKYRIIAVTSRRQSLLDITREWLDSNYPDIIDEVVSSGIYGSGKRHAHKLTKAEILKEVGPDFHIDDQPKHCIGAASVGVQAILFGDYPWLRDVELPGGVVRCKDWPAVLEYFDGRG
jgi:uncharacterized HAD superfamily protein